MEGFEITAKQGTERQQGALDTTPKAMGSDALRETVEKPKHVPFHATVRASSDDEVVDMEPGWYLRGEHAGMHIA